MNKPIYEDERNYGREALAMAAWVFLVVWMVGVSMAEEPSGGCSTDTECEETSHD